MLLNGSALNSVNLGGDDFRATFAVEQEAGGQSIIEVARFVDHSLIERLHREPQALQVMDRRQFEELIAELFSGFGYDVELTRRTKDGGKDIIAIKRREVDVRFLIECKRPNPGNAVSVSTVRELLGVKHSDGVSKAILATTTYLSPDARLFVEKNQWELEAREFDAIKAWIAEYLGRPVQ